MMKKVLVLSFVASLLMGCETQKLSTSYTQGKEIVIKPIQIPNKPSKFKLVYGNDQELKAAFNQYTKTGRAPNIVTEGFIKFAYNKDQQPIIKTSPFQETVISLEPGEKYTNISSGDPNRWSYAVATSGSGGEQQQNVLVKPSQSDIATNMVIATNKRIYNLKLISTKSATKSVSFWYPDEMMHGMNDFTNENDIATVPDVNLNNLNFDYSMSNYGLFSRPISWKPVRTFDDGKHTFIQFPKQISERDMPVLFVLAQGEKELVNYRSKPPYFVVDKIFKQAILVLGVGRTQQTITLTNNNY